MKQLRYIKLFEAFESEKLSKTLAYIETKDRNLIKDKLEKICRNIDFPFSQLSDEYFQYLPFQKALKVNYESKKTPCKMTSKSAFGSSGIEGESCQKIGRAHV